ncbi:hypothetical protein EDD86DRAFT_244499 [Gorgonomyces haynaldii]|nr:hypothetical protein EDD86DRAFT_244499 [Gorgonomyces haynaldii]
MSFVGFSVEQKQATATAIERMLSVWVNQEIKQTDFNITVTPLGNVSQLDDLSFHMNNARLTNYYLPPPYGCYSLMTAVSFQIADSPDLMNPTIVVSSLSKYPQVLQLSVVQNLSFGDQLLLVNGQSFSDYYEANKQTFGGANRYAGYRNALKSLSFLSTSLYPLPTADEVQLTMLSQQGNTYNLSLPWIAMSNPKCLAEASGIQSFRSEPRTPSQGHPTFTQFAKAFDLLPPVSLTKTVEPTLSWAIFDPQNTSLGIIRISGFTSKGSISDYIQVLSSLLQRELKRTRSLVFDVRDNAGGDIELANSITMLFTETYDPELFRARVTPFNDNVFAIGLAGPVWQSVYQASQGQNYTTPIPFSALPLLDRKYLKQVGVFTNANCFSACDIFAASMQDTANATIVGEDYQTAGGGANVVYYNQFLSGSSDFPKLPFATQMPQYGPEMRVAWRQVLRSGPRKGQLLENKGVQSELLVRPTISDIVNGSNSQWPRIAAYLQQKAVSRGIDDISFDISPKTQSVPLGSPIIVNVTCSKIALVSAMYPNQTIIATYKIPTTTKTFPVAFTAFSSVGVYEFQMAGYDVNGNKVLVTTQTVEITPSTSGYFSLGGPFHWNFDLTSAGVGLYNINSDPSNGWQSNGQQLQIGDGQEYAANVNSSLSLYFNPAPLGRVAIRVQGMYDTMDGLDFFHFGFQDQLGTNPILTSKDPITGKTLDGVSGFNVIDGTYFITPSGKFELYFGFTSLASPSGQGVVITSLDLVSIPIVPTRTVKSIDMPTTTVGDTSPSRTSLPAVTPQPTFTPPRKTCLFFKFICY